jgi:hypothetical protein
MNEAIANQESTSTPSLWQLAGLLPTDETAYPDLETYVQTDTTYTRRIADPTPAQQRSNRANGLLYHVKRLRRQAERMKKIERERMRVLRQLARCDERIEQAAAEYQSMAENVRYYSL